MIRLPNDFFWYFFCETAALEMHNQCNWKKSQKFWSALWLACCLSKAFEVVWRLVHHLCITFKNPFFKSWFWKIKANFVFVQENFVTLHRYITISGFFLLKINDFYKNLPRSFLKGARGCWSLPCTDVSLRGRSRFTKYVYNFKDSWPLAHIRVSMDHRPT